MNWETGMIKAEIVLHFEQFQQGAEYSTTDRPNNKLLTSQCTVTKYMCVTLSKDWKDVRIRDLTASFDSIKTIRVVTFATELGLKNPDSEYLARPHISILFKYKFFRWYLWKIYVVEYLRTLLANNNVCLIILPPVYDFGTVLEQRNAAAGFVVERIPPYLSQVIGNSDF